MVVVSAAWFDILFPEDEHDAKEIYDLFFDTFEQWEAKDGN